MSFFFTIYISTLTAWVSTGSIVIEILWFQTKQNQAMQNTASRKCQV